jgi:hypothetical protein
VIEFADLAEKGLFVFSAHNLPINLWPKEKSFFFIYISKQGVGLK